MEEGFEISATFLNGEWVARQGDRMAVGNSAIEAVSRVTGQPLPPNIPDELQQLEAESWERRYQLAQEVCDDFTRQLKAINDCVEAFPDKPEFPVESTLIEQVELLFKLASEAKWLESEKKQLKQLVQDHYETRSIRYGGGLYQQVQYLLGSYRENEAKAAESLLNLKEDVRVWMRAIAMVIDSAANADTHKEKNARLRGALSLVESSIQRLKNHTQSQSSWYEYPDMFKSDYPVRRYAERIKALESELAGLRPTEESKPTEKPAEKLDDMPF